jgi:Ca2+-dependent lipid-binding protein
VVKKKHPLLAATKIASTYEMVEPMWYLYVSVVKARDLPGLDLACSIDPYVEVKLGNFKAVTTKYFHQNRNPVWREKFNFRRDHLQSTVLEIMLRDKDLLKDSFLGRVVLDLSHVPSRLPQDSRLTPQWYRLANEDGGYNKLGLYAMPDGIGEIKLAVWFGTQHDESFPSCSPSPKRG